MSPDSVTARYHLAMVLLTRGEQDEAIRELQTILAIEPNHVPAQIDLAVLAISRRDWDDAHRRLEVALAAEPQNPRGLFYRAVVLDRLDRPEEAAGILESLAHSDDRKYASRARQYLQERSEAGQ